jgi:hypothetical protein
VDASPPVDASAPASVTLYVTSPDIIGLGAAHGEVEVRDGKFTVVDQETADKWLAHPDVRATP